MVWFENVLKNDVIFVILIYVIVFGNYLFCMVELFMFRSKWNFLFKFIFVMVNWLILIV